MKEAYYSKKGQTAVEYMLLFAVVVAIVFIGFKTYLPKSQESMNLYYNKVGTGIYGMPSRCGDGVQDVARGETAESCCADFGTCGAFQNL